MVQEEAVAKPKPSKYIETKYSDKVTFMANRSPQIRLPSSPPPLLACSDGSINDTEILLISRYCQL
jgi:hypothetical protein